MGVLVATYACRFSRNIYFEHIYIKQEIYSEFQNEKVHTIQHAYYVHMRALE